MKHHLLNLFPIMNLPDLRISYRLLRIKNLSNLDSSLYETNLSRIAKNIALEIKQPAALLRKGDDAFIAIPASARNPALEQQVVPDVVALEPRDEIEILDYGKLNSKTMPIALRFLKFYLKSPLIANSKLWGLGHNRFFSHRPINYKNFSREIDIYGGFVFGLIADEENKIFLCVDLTYKYIDRYFLTEYLKNSGVTIKEHFQNRHCLYQYGVDWYAIQLLGAGEKNIKEQEFSLENGTTGRVLGWTLDKCLEKCKKCNKPLPDYIRNLDPGSPSIVYKYPNREMKPRYGAAALCRLMYKTEDPKVQSIHGYSIKEPQKRFSTIHSIVKRYFSKAQLGSIPIKVSKNCLREKPKVFSIPNLKFANNTVLHVKRNKDDNGVSLADFGKARMRFLLDNGTLANSPFDPQYVLVPEEIIKEIAKAFKLDYEETMRNLAKQVYQAELVVYPIAPMPSIRRQYKLINNILESKNIRHGFVLMLLPSSREFGKNYISKLHNFLKRQYYPNIKFQCAKTENVTDFYSKGVNPNGDIEYSVPDEKQKFFKSYMRYLCLGMLQVNRKWLYALEKPLHYDVYISIDVHDRFAGFCFFYKNGENIVFDAKEIPLTKSKNGRVEKVSRKLIFKVIYEQLKQDIPKYGLDPNAMIILRDGQSYSEEIIALKSVIAKLRSDNIVNQEKYVQIGVVDLHKHSSVPIRMATEFDDFDNLKNPQIGSYREFNSREGAIWNTGFPFRFRGTAKSLLVSIAYGELNIVWILEDIFCQSLLAFSAPDKCSFNPFPIKLVDDLLEPLTAPLDEEEALLENEIDELELIEEV